MIDFSGFSAYRAQLSATLPVAGKITEFELAGIYGRLYAPESTPEDILIVYHGGGVNSDAGYDILARQVSDGTAVAVCLVDIRGHGRSSGHPGKVSTPTHIWRDVDTVVGYMHATFPHARIHLLGHSSGGGMLINYFTRYTPTQKCNSMILIAPEFGPFAPAEIRKSTAPPFASVNTWPFIINALSLGWLSGDRFAITLHFPEDVLASNPQFVKQYSVNMANALTPRQPATQLALLPVPVTVLLAEKDELFDARLTATFLAACANQQLRCQVIANSHHLDCLFKARDLILQHLIAHG